MDITACHAKYFAHDLTRRCASDSVEKLASVLSDAQVDLNPHQIEAALFAFRSPFSRGAILADEVGLGKTIEAGLLLAQKWAERKRRLLVIVPANLRKQWGQELVDKFHLPSVILENRSFNDTVRAGNLNPFQQQAIVLCSYQFACKKEPYLQQTPWDLVVIDEAHRLRNIYKASSKIANAIKQAVAPFPKVLLTATPLQNSLLELYGLVSIIDDYTFGDLKSYRSRFTRLGNTTDFNELQERLKPLCKRTLRKQVLEYVKYTNRHALVQEFVPTAEEQRLYDLVSAYLQQPMLYALPASQRQLMTLILRKLLASSTYAISDTLAGLARKLEMAVAQAEAVDTPPEELADNWEALEELADEWDEDSDTEAAAEGINLQFCNLVVNYDLPWNPQRIEQRIGRCHRYGQKFDVVVVNFLNKNNAADKRVYELLAEKFRLFSGVFGASDEVLGAVESGVDFEKRIAAIYQKCRTPEQIQFEFDQLQGELETEIAEGQRDAREKLLNNFDQEVVERVRIQSHDYLDRFNERLWLLTRYLLAPYARFEEQEHRFTLERNPFPGEIIHPGPYRMGRNVEDTNTYRVGHPLAQRILEKGKGLSVPPGEVIFHLSGSGKNIAILERLVGKCGWLSCLRVSVSALDTEDHLLLSGVSDEGEILDAAQCRRCFDLPGEESRNAELPANIKAILDEVTTRQQQELLGDIAAKNGQWFDTEMDKLDRWAEDRRTALRVELEELDLHIRETRKAARLAPNLPDKLECQRALRRLEAQRDEAWRSYDAASREIDQQKDSLLDEISRRLQQQTTQELLFTLRWCLV